MGFGRRRPTAKQQGPGSQGQPRPALPSGEQRASGENGLRSFSEHGAMGLLFAARGDFPFAECSCQKLVLGHRSYGASALSGRAGSGDMAGAWAQKAFAHAILLPQQGEPLGSGVQWPETPSKAAGPREPGAAQPRFALWRVEGGGRKRLALLS